MRVCARSGELEVDAPPLRSAPCGFGFLGPTDRPCLRLVCQCPGSHVMSMYGDGLELAVRVCVF